MPFGLPRAVSPSNGTDEGTARRRGEEDGFDALRWHSQFIAVPGAREGRPVTAPSVGRDAVPKDERLSMNLKRAILVVALGLLVCLLPLPLSPVTDDAFHHNLLLLGVVVDHFPGEAPSIRSVNPVILVPTLAFSAFVVWVFCLLASRLGRAGKLVFAVLGVCYSVAAIVCLFQDLKPEGWLVAHVEITKIAQALGAYQLDVGQYPTTSQGLKALETLPPGVTGWHGPYMRRVPNDPWGHPYHYRQPGPAGTPFKLFSLGRDGVPSKDDIRLGAVGS